MTIAGAVETSTVSLHKIAEVFKQVAPLSKKAVLRLSEPEVA